MGVKAFFYSFPIATLNTETHKNSVRIKAPNSANASKRKHKNHNKIMTKQTPYMKTQGKRKVQDVPQSQTQPFPDTKRKRNRRRTNKEELQKRGRLGTVSIKTTGWGIGAKPVLFF